MNSANDEVSLDGLRVDDAKRVIGEWLERAGLGRADRHLQAARLAVQPAALLGRAVPDRLRRHRPDRAARVDAAGRAARDHRLRARDLRRSRRAAGAAARARRGLGRGRARPRPAPAWAGYGDGRARVPPRDEHDAAVGRFVLVLPALPRPHQRGSRSSTPRSSGSGRRERASTGRRSRGSSTSTSAASSTRCCTCSTRGSGTRCCSTSVTCRRVEPFQRLVNQGMIQAAAYTDERGMYVEAVGGGRARRRVLLRRRAGHARVRQDGQEPEERGHAPTTSSTSTAPTRCASTRCSPARSTRRGRGTRPTSSACTASCSGCGAT